MIVSAGAISRRAAATSSGAGSGFLFGSVSPQTTASKKRARANAFRISSVGPVVELKEAGRECRSPARVGADGAKATLDELADAVADHVLHCLEGESGDALLGEEAVERLGEVPGAVD